jgi:Na+/proline symporter
MAMGTGIFVLFVTMGGLLAVVWTDILLFVLMWTGLIALLPAVKAAAGGMTHVLTAADAVAPGWTSVRGTTWTWTYLLSWWLVWIIGYSTRVTMITKVFAAKDTKVARISLPITDALFMLFLLYGNLYLGAAARVLVWDQISKAPDQAFPALVTHVSTLAGTPWLGALAITGVVSAAIATSDSLLLMSGAAVAHDFMRKCYFEPRGVLKTEKYYLKISRVAVVVVGVVSFLAALRTPDLILNIVSYAVALVGVAFFFPMLFGLNSPYLSRKAATYSSVAGSLAGLVWTVPHLAAAGWARQHAPWMLDIHPVVPGFFAAAIPILLMRSKTIEMSDATRRVFFPEGTSGTPV